MSKAQVEAKRAAARAACEYLEDGMTVGLGTGSTAAHAVKRIGELVAEGMDLRGVPTSIETMELAKQVSVPLVELDDCDAIDVTIDGADEVDPRLDLIKGLGGALLREKIVAAVTERQVIVVDESKVVEKLGTQSPLPVEVVKFGWVPVKRALQDRGYQAELRRQGDTPFLTDNGNFILDVVTRGIDDAPALEAELNNIPGVVENGLFLGMTWKAIVGNGEGETRELDGE